MLKLQRILAGLLSVSLAACLHPVLAAENAAAIAIPDITSATKSVVPAANLAADKAGSLANQIYSTSSPDACFGDLTIPACETNQALPAVIVVHGGSWSTGSKDDPDVKDMAQMLVSKGFVVFAINYRLLAQGGQYPNNIEDVKSAVRFLHANAGKYHIDSNRVAILGTSAGGYLALMAAYTAVENAERVQAVVAVCPATDLARIARPLVEQYLGARLKKKSKLLNKTSPIAFAKTGVPTLFVHGTADQVIAFQQSVDLQQALDKAKIPAELVPVDGADHGFILRAGDARDLAYGKVADYLMRRLAAPAL